MDNSIRKKLKSIIDELCSSDNFVTYEEILCEYYGEELPSIGSLPEFQSLKNLKRELCKNQVIEFKNGKNAKEGFRYISGNADFFNKQEERQYLVNF